MNFDEKAKDIAIDHARENSITPTTDLAEKISQALKEAYAQGRKEAFEAGFQAKFDDEIVAFIAALKIHPLKNTSNT